MTANAMSGLRPLPLPDLRKSPFEHAVDGLDEQALTSVDGQDVEIRDLDRAWFAEVCLVTVDAVLARDKPALDGLDSLLRRVNRVLVIERERYNAGDSAVAKTADLACWENWTQLSLDMLRSALDRVAPVAAATNIAGTHAELFLRIVAGQPGINSRQIRKQMALAPGGTGGRVLDEGQLSKIGSKLRAQGLVYSQRGGQGLAWELTPRGRLVIDRLLGVDEEPDRPVTRLVIAGPEAPAGEVTAELDAAEPAEVTVLTSDQVVVYHRRAADGSDAAPARNQEPMPVKDAVDGLLTEAAPTLPFGFSLESGTVYEKVEHRVPVGA